LSQKYDLSIEFTETNLPAHLAEQSALCLFRIAQEALNNARKYSQTTEFAVGLRGNANEVELTISAYAANGNKT
jgi:signal transduction histidine kinase